MRIAAILTTLTLAIATAAPAFACQFGDGPPPPPKPVFWSAPPPSDQLEPGEIVIEAFFLRTATGIEKNGKDVVVVECGVESRVYRITRVIAGDTQGQNDVIVLRYRGLEFDTSNQILVGRFAPVFDEPGAAPHLRTFEPRLPIQSP